MMSAHFWYFTRTVSLSCRRGFCKSPTYALLTIVNNASTGMKKMKNINKKNTYVNSTNNKKITNLV